MPENQSENGQDLSGATQSPSPSVAFPLWLKAIVVIGATLVLAGALIGLLRPGLLVAPHAEINEAVRIYAGYLFSRNFALAIMLLGAMVLRARGTLNSLMVLAAFVQLLDGGVDILSGRWRIVPGVIILGVLFLVGSARLSGYPFWRIEAWKRSF
jgi:hypothetical protein